MARHGSSHGRFGNPLLVRTHCLWWMDERDDGLPGCRMRFDIRASPVHVSVISKVGATCATPIGLRISDAKCTNCRISTHFEQHADVARTLTDQSGVRTTGRAARRSGRRAVLTDLTKTVRPQSGTDNAQPDMKGDAMRFSPAKERFRSSRSIAQSMKPIPPTSPGPRPAPQPPNPIPLPTPLPTPGPGSPKPAPPQ